MKQSNASISISLFANLNQFSTEMQNASRKLNKMGRQMQSLGKTLSVGLTAPLAAFGIAGVRAFDQQAKAIADVEAALKSTGGTANKTLADLTSSASELQNNSLFGDEEILKSVTAQLLTFTNIANTEFDRTQQAALDLATRLDGDLKGASIQLGKALNDPIEGLSALGRSGIQFTDSQKEVIKSLAESGRLAEAQNLILDELEKQYGGAAAAAAQAGTGPLKQLSNILGDISEDFGKIILEALAPFIAKLKELAIGFQNLSPQTKRIIAIIGGLAAAIGPVVVAIGALLPMLPAIAAGFAAITGPVGLAVTGITALSAAFLVFSNNVNSNAKRLNDFTAKLYSNSIGLKNNLSNVEGLVVEYENLKSKTSLSAVEQERLKVVVQKLSEEIPSAITAFDEYGNALDVNSKKVRKFLTDQTELNKAQAKVNLNNLEASLVSLQEQQAKLNALNEDGNSVFIKGVGLVKRLNGVLGQGRGIRFNPLDDEAVLLVQKRISSNREDLAITQQNIQKNKELLDVLNGIKEVEETTVVVNDKKTKGQPVSDVSENKIPEIVQEIPLKFVGGDFSSIESSLVNSVNKAVEQLPELNYEVPLKFTNGDFETGVSQTINTAEALNERMQQFKETAQGVSSGVAGAFSQLSNSMINSFGEASNGMEAFAQNIFRLGADLISMLIQNAIQNILIRQAESTSNAIAGATQAGAATGAAAPFTTPAFISTAVAGVASAFAAIPKFADGGVVFGPTLGLMGEYAGAANNPEVIAPLNKLKDLMEPNSAAPVVIGGNIRARGSELEVVLERQNRQNKRRR